MQNNKNNKDTKRTYKIPETPILDILLAKAGKGFCKSSDFIEKVLKIKVV